MSHHHGSCHCGAVQFDAEVDLTKLATCNCSICGRSGAIMAFVGADALTNIVGEDKLTDYQFGKKAIHHAFCSVCGVRPFGRAVDAANGAMINVRCLEGLDAHELEISAKYDGKSL